MYNVNVFVNIKVSYYCREGPLIGKSIRDNINTLLDDRVEASVWLNLP